MEMATGLIGASALFLLIVISLRSRIQIAIEVVKEASRALTQMSSMLVFPIIPLALALGYFVFWIIIALYLYSIATTSTEDVNPLVQAGSGNTNPSTQVVYNVGPTLILLLLLHVPRQRGI